MYRADPPASRRRPRPLPGPARLAGLLLTALFICLRTTATAQPPPAEAALSPRNASYRIEARLLPDERRLEGRQILTWTNTSPRPAEELRFHLYWNAWRNDRSTWMLEDRFRRRSSRGDHVRPEDWSWIEVSAARLLGADGEPVADLTRGLRYDAPDDGNPEDRTVLVVPLPQPVPPGGSLRVAMEWRGRVPRTFARTGFRGDYFFIAQWFPKLGVLEEEGWNCHQFHAATEFFADYGSYDVELTVPADWVVGATGLEVDTLEGEDGTRTHRFRQDDVHDFAWTTSPDFLVREARFEASELPPVALRLLLQPEHAAQADRLLAATRVALERYGTWYGPYPYGHLTIVDPAYGSGSGGMEYPTLFTAGTRLLNPPTGGSPEGVTIHEAGHQFWYGLVGDNEFEHAWLDEGLNTFSTARAYAADYGERRWVKRYFSPPGTDLSGFFPLVFDELPLSREVFGNRLHRYRRSPSADAEAKPTYLYHPATAGNITYSKTALWLATLERLIGWDALRTGMSDFFRAWSFRHPRPADFFGALEAASGRDLDWFFEQVYFGDAAFDYAIESATSEEIEPRGWTESEGGLVNREEMTPEDGAEETTVYRSEVVVRRNAGGRFPVAVRLVFEDGSELRREWDGQDRWTLLVEERPQRLEFAEVDPDRILLLDLDRTNNSRRVEPRSTFAVVKWSSRWMLWLQDYLETLSFFL